MVAVLTTSPRHHLPAVSATGGAAARPVPLATYRRRRAVCGLLVGAVLVGAVLVAAIFVLGRFGAASASDIVGAGVPATAVGDGHAGTTHVVEPGDTVWSVARRLQPDGDVRGLVDRIVARNGGATVTVGQRLMLDD